MKKRYVGIVRLTPQGDGVIEILNEEVKSPSPTEIENPHKAFAAARSPY